jgi:hypothetical protein
MHLGYISLVSFSIHQKINWPILCALSLACIKLRIWFFERLENLSESARDGLFPFCLGCMYVCINLYSALSQII